LLESGWLCLPPLVRPPLNLFFFPSRRMRSLDAPRRRALLWRVGEQSHRIPILTGAILGVGSGIVGPHLVASIPPPRSGCNPSLCREADVDETLRRTMSSIRDLMPVFWFYSLFIFPGPAQSKSGVSFRGGTHLLFMDPYFLAPPEISF